MRISFHATTTGHRQFGLHGVFSPDWLGGDKNSSGNVQWGKDPGGPESDGTCAWARPDKNSPRAPSASQSIFV